MLSRIAVVLLTVVGLLYPTPSTAGGRITLSGIEFLMRDWDGAPPDKGNAWWGNSPAIEAKSGGVTLRVVKAGSLWYSAELQSASKNMRYGEYCFYVSAALDTLDPNLVFSIFLYEDRAHEADIEFSKWGNRRNSFNTQFILQPGGSGHQSRFMLPSGLMQTTHCINWQADKILFSSYRGHSKSRSNLIKEWPYSRETGRIPRQGNTNLILNLWLVGGKGTSPLGREGTAPNVPVIYEVTIVRITHPN